MVMCVLVMVMCVLVMVMCVLVMVMCILVYININQLDALNFIMSLFHASTCFEHMCSKHVEALNKLIVKQILCIKLVDIKINILRCTVSKISKCVLYCIYCVFLLFAYSYLLLM